jgi:hypothetical protein
MKITEDKKDPSLRGSLIRSIAEYILPYLTWEDSSTLKPALDLAFETNLNFKVQVTEAKVFLDQALLYTQVIFIDENNTNKAIDITVSYGDNKTKQN